MHFDEVEAITAALGPLASFASVDADGTPHVVPVVASWSSGMLVFGSRADSVKVRNLVHRPRASMAFATPGEPFPDTALLKGRARVVEDDEERAAWWGCGLFPFLSMMYSGPDDPALRFVEFTPTSAVVVRNGGRGPVQRWRAPALIGD